MEATQQQEILESVFELAPELLDQFDTTATVEQCGLLFGRRDRGHYVIETVVPVENSAPSPERAFAIKRSHAKEVVLKQRGSLLGVLHTHWEGATYPSNADVNSIPLGWLGVVFHTKKRIITYYNRHGYISEVQL